MTILMFLDNKRESNNPDKCPSQSIFRFKKQAKNDLDSPC